MSAQRKVRQPVRAAPARPKMRAPLAPGQPYPKATYQDLLDAPPYKVAEIIDGKFYAHPRPASPHLLAGSVLHGSLFQGLGGGDQDPDGWWILHEPELHLGDPLEPDVLVPDLAGWRASRMPRIPDVPYFTLAPDWVCEILSPSTRRLDLGAKRAIYAREGIAWLWFIDPPARTLEAYALNDENEWQRQATLEGDANVSLPPFETISFPLNSLWL